MHKLPILKSQSGHIRTSKTGKVFSAGSGIRNNKDIKNQLNQLIDGAKENIKSTWERWKKEFPEEEGIENDNEANLSHELCW